MEKKLPNVYVNNSARQLKSNNKNLFYSLDQMLDNSSLSIEPKNAIKQISVRKKISDIFSSSKFIYKIKVLIETKSEGSIKEVIISKEEDGILTLSNKKIKYEDIIDIKII